MTSSQSRDRLARICVKIDIDKKLIPKFTMSDLSFVLNLEYEGLHVMCFGCGKDMATRLEFVHTTSFLTQTKRRIRSQSMILRGFFSPKETESATRYASLCTVQVSKVESATIGKPEFYGEYLFGT